MLLSIVVPVFREEKNIPEFLRRIRPILGEITPDYEIIFSMESSWIHPLLVWAQRKKNGF
jgi:dolichol-phosphate mannosyltransferase